MENKTVRISLDFRGSPFIVEACETDNDGTTLSTHEWLDEEISNIGLDDVLGNQEFEDGIYDVTIDGGWGYEHIEYNYDIIFTLRK